MKTYNSNSQDDANANEIAGYFKQHLFADLETTLYISFEYKFSNINFMFASIITIPLLHTVLLCYCYFLK